MLQNSTVGPLYGEAEYSNSGDRNVPCVQRSTTKFLWASHAPQHVPTFNTIRTRGSPVDVKVNTQTGYVRYHGSPVHREGIHASSDRPHSASEIAGILRARM